MKRAPAPVLAMVTLGALASLAPLGIADADSQLPPWYDKDDLPLPTWAKSVAPKRDDVAIFVAPGRTDLRRGTALATTRLPFYGAKRAASCAGRWLEIGPMAWVCSDVADLSPDAPWSARDEARWQSAPAADGLPFRYYFVGRDGAYGYDTQDEIDEDAPAQEYEAGFSVALVTERTLHGERWGKTNHGKWIPLRDLVPARAPAFHGIELQGDAPLDVAWVVSDRATVRKGPSLQNASVGTRARFELVAWREEKAAPGGPFVRISEDGASPSQWMQAKDLAHPSFAPPPPPAPPDVEPGERWIDVDLASQTLVAWDGARPVYATMVSTGRGPQGSETATPRGVHRIWVKLTTTNMDNLEQDDAERHYSIEDVPYVQFFDKGVALHAAFWHQGFGRVQSHGCVNLAPLDARWLFAFTAPHLPAGWSAALPTPLERGTPVRIR